MADTDAEIVELVKRRTLSGDIKWANRYPERAAAPAIGLNGVVDLMREDVFTAEFTGQAGRLFLVLRSPGLTGLGAAAGGPSLTLQDEEGGNEKVLWAAAVPELLTLVVAVKAQELQAARDADSRIIEILK
jgi:hypothetical protein